MKQAWNRLGTPDAISWVLVLLSSIQIMAGSLTAPFVDTTGRFAEFIAIRCVSLLVALAILGIGKLLLLRFAVSHPKPWLTLLVFASVTLGMTVTMNGLLILTNFTHEWNILRRIIVALPGFFTILIISAILVAYARESSRRNEELSETIFELVRTRTEASTRILERKRTLVDSIKRELKLSLTNLDIGDEREISTKLRSLIDDVVRPMSYRLSTDIAPQEMRQISSSHNSVSWNLILREAVRSNPAHPVSSTLWIALLLGAFLITGFGVSGLLGTGSLICLALGVLSLTRITWRYIPSSVPDWVRALLFSLSILLFTALSTPFISSFTGYDFTAPTVFIGWFLLNFCMTWTVTLVNAVNQNLRETFQQLSETYDDLKREVVHLNNELRLLQKNVSRILHGPVQEAITASLIRLNQDSGLTPSNELVEDLQNRIAEALELVEDPQGTKTDLIDSLSDMVELWDEVAQIEIDASPSALHSVKTDIVARSAMLELIREACGNAIRHGEAKKIQVSLVQRTNTGLLVLTVTNDGKQLSSDLTPGLGTQLFDEMCITWSRQQDGSLVRFDAEIPFSK